MRILASAIWETAYWVLMLGGVAGVALGLLLLLSPERAFGLGDTMNRWISTRSAMKPLETPMAIERHVYRNHRIFGVVVLAGALYTLYYLGWKIPSAWIVEVLSKKMDAVIARAIVESVRVFLIVCNAFAAAIALVVLVRPSALKNLEAWANRRWSERSATKPLEIPRYGIDAFMRRRPALLGGLLVAGGAYALIALVFLRLAGQWAGR